MFESNSFILNEFWRKKAFYSMIKETPALAHYKTKCQKANTRSRIHGYIDRKTMGSNITESELKF